MLKQQIIDQNKQRLMDLYYKTIQMRMMRQSVGECVDFLIEEGVIVPNYNIGETVYLVLSGKVIKATIEEITYNKQGLYYNLQTEFGVKLRATSACLCLTREEAEEKIKK